MRLCTLALLFLCAAAAAEERRPNVLFLFSDDQRHDTIGALGNPHIRTPQLDRLVERGFTFTHGYCMGSMSGAVCQPSRAMLMTGRTLWRAPPRLQHVPLLPAVLGRAGYRTFGIGKWHNGRASFQRAFQDGAAIFFGGMSDHHRVPVMDYDPSGKYPREKQRPGAAFSSRLFADAAIRFLEGYDADAPFFLYVSFTAPHDPRTPPKEFLYDAGKLPVPRSFLPRHPFDNGELKVRDEKLAPWPRTPEIVRRHEADYYGMIGHLDAQIGRVLQALEKSGHARHTIVVFTSDHGLAVGRHGLLGKQNLYEHSMRVPIVVAGPGIRPGRSARLAYLLDLFPTLCALTGVQAPDGVEGRNLFGRPARQSVFCAYRGFQRSVRDARFKLIRYTVKDRVRTQLFDLEKDPCEIENLAADPAHAATRTRLEALLRQWQRELDDPQGAR